MNKGHIHYSIITQNYIKKQLGKGSFGNVYEGLNNVTGKSVAIKVIPKIKNDSRKIQAQLKKIKNQYWIMKQLKHNQNIVEIYSFIDTQQSYNYVMELCDKTLKDVIKEIYTEEDALTYFKQILSGYYSLIASGIVHRDLKPQNILFKGRIVKLADFGCATINNHSVMDQLVGTQNYKSPEILLDCNYSYKCDIWSLGVILYEMIFKTYPIPKKQGEDIRSYLKKIHNIDETLKFHDKPQISQQCKDLLRNCLKFKEENRADWQYIFHHKLFQNDNLPDVQKLASKQNYILTALNTQIIGLNIDSQKLFSKYSNNNKQINFKNFLNMIFDTIPHQRITHEEIKYTFSSFDKDSDEVITFEQFQCLLKKGFKSSKSKKNDHYMEKMLIKMVDRFILQGKISKQINQQSIDMFLQKNQFNFTEQEKSVLREILKKKYQQK